MYYSRRLVNPAAFQGMNVSANINGQLKNLWHAGFFAGYEPSGNNFYEPRIEGRFFKGWSNYFIGGFFNTNDAKKYAAGFEMMFVDRSIFSSKRYSLEFSNRYRFNNRITVYHSIEINPQKRNAGFADIDDATNEIIFGKRDISEIEDVLGAKYSFSSKMNINLRIRHYWNQVRYSQYYTLEQNGTLKENNTYTGNANMNFNFFNIDLVYTWQFAPGSFLNIVWKNAAEDFGRDVSGNYFKNMDKTLQAKDNNNFSMKIIYFLDYLKLKKQLKKA